MCVFRCVWKCLTAYFHLLLHHLIRSPRCLIKGPITKPLHGNFLPPIKLYIIGSCFLSCSFLLFVHAPSLSLPQHRPRWTSAFLIPTTFIKTGGIIHRFPREIPEDVLSPRLPLSSLSSRLPAFLFWGLTFRLTPQEQCHLHSFP